MIASERPRAVFSRQLMLGDTLLDTDRVDARYGAGDLTLRIPVAEKARPRKVQIQHNGQDNHQQRTLSA